MTEQYKIKKLCEMAKLSRSAYYKWLKPKNRSIREKQNCLIKQLIKKAHIQFRGIYGKRRMYYYVNSHVNFKVNHKRIYRIMKELNIKALIRKKVYKRRFKPFKIVKNVLNRNFTTTIPLQKLCMDITYIPLGKGLRQFLYMNAVKDLYNNEIIAYDFSKYNNVELVQNTLEKLFKMKLAENCILHTDQGFQYTRKMYISKLKDKGIIQSMSRKGNCWDNAPIESFFSHFKTESINIKRKINENELIEEIHNYIKFYNNERIQIKNGLSPVQFRTQTA